MNRLIPRVAAIVLLCLVAGVAQAAVNISTVVVGDKGNAADITTFGAVSYDYSIGKYEVTAAQYTEFLNAVAKSDPFGLYNPSMSSNARGCKIVRSGVSGSYEYTVAADYANRPVNYVSYWDACRFANWLNNGQGISSTEIGAYTLTPEGIAANNILRNEGWSWAVANENEWYKAAYYKGESLNAGYWKYATQSNTAPINTVTTPDAGNNANFFSSVYSIGAPYYRTTVGEFENSESAYGTFDQVGNVAEWNEAIMGGNAYRGMRGGSFSSSGFLASTDRTYKTPTYENSELGFRVVQAVPEPSSVAAGIALLTPLLALRRRKA